MARPTFFRPLGWAKLFLRVSVGSNPWPVAGVVGHVAAAITGAVALVFLLLLALAMSKGDVNQGFFGLDYIPYFTAATLVLNGEADRLYDADRQWEVQRALLDSVGANLPKVNEYANPPLWAAVVTMLHPFGLLGGVLVWRILTIVVSLAISLAIAGQGPRPSGWQRSAALILCFFPFVDAWYTGQMVVPMLVAFGGWFLLARANRPRFAGLALSLGLLKPQYVPFMVVFLTWKRQWAQLQGFAAGALAQALLTLLLFLPGGRLPVFDTLLTFAGAGGNPPHNYEINLTVRAAIWRLLPDVDQSARLALVAGLTVVLMTAFLWAVGREWDPNGRAFAWESLALIAITCITAYHNLILNLYLLLPPLLALLVPGRAPGEPRGYGPGLAALVALPSVGFLVNPSAYLPYYLASWAMALGAIGLGLLGYRDSANWKRAAPDEGRQGRHPGGDTKLRFPLWLQAQPGPQPDKHA